jgi:hypothetical protein
VSLNVGDDAPAPRQRLIEGLNPTTGGVVGHGSLP